MHLSKMITKCFGNKQKHMVNSLIDKKNSHKLVKLVICYWESKKEKKNMLFSSKNHKCIYFSFHLKIINKTYLFLIK